MRAVQRPSDNFEVSRPGCGKKFLGIPGAECYCACGTTFRISLYKDGYYQVTVSRGRAGGGDRTSRPNPEPSATRRP